MSELRVGTGFDAHAFEDGVPLVLGGVRFDHPRGLAGHSDGDVIAHALTDAILGAAGLGDIGSLFPSGDDRFRGAVSIELLRERQIKNFLATLPQFLLREHAPTAPTANAPARARHPQPVGAMAAVGENGGDGAGEVMLDLPVRRSMPKVGRNEPCPCGSGKKYKNCCGRVA